MRLIDADALGPTMMGLPIPKSTILNLIDAAPTVCCAECAYFNHKISECSATGEDTRPDGVCKWFERRTP